MTVAPGRSFPLGATVVDGGVNFCVYSGRAKQLELLLFDGATTPNPPTCSTRGVHPSELPLLARLHSRPLPWASLRYRAAGPFDPSRGRRFDPAKVLLDPYARAVVVPDAYDRATAGRPGENTASRCEAWS